MNKGDMHSRNTRNLSQKVFVFFGSDVKSRGKEFLQKISKKGYILLPLDTPAIGMAAEAKLPYTLIDDWVDSEAMLKVRKQADECERGWFQSARELFTVDGVCWPEFDHHAMHWFWLDIMLAMALADVFRARKVQELGFLINPLKRPAVFYSPSDVCYNFWQAELPGVAHSMGISQKPPLRYYLPPAIREILRKAKRLVLRQTLSPVATPANSFSEGKLVLAFNDGEIHRFTPIVKRLYQGMQGKLAAILLPGNSLNENLAGSWPIAISNSPPTAAVNVELAQRFLQAYSRVMDSADGQPWQMPLRHLRFHFKYYYEQRWLTLVAGLRYWSELWRTASPRAVIVSSLQDSESQLPAQAAKNLAIPSFSIPHGAVIGRPLLVPSEYVLYNLLTQKKVYERVGVDSRRLIPCRDVIVENEYPVVPARMDTTHKWRALALTDPIYFPDFLFPAVSPTAQLAALQALAMPPSDIEEKLSLNLKAHPGFPELEIFSVVGKGIAKKLLPTNSELKSVLQETDLVISVNYSGSALVHALRAGKPLIYLWTDPLLGKVETKANVDLWLPAGTLVRSADEFWSLVRRFITEPELAAELRMKAKRFTQENLDDQKYPSISEAISRVLGETGQ